MTKLLVEFILNSNCVLVLLRQPGILIIPGMLQAWPMPVPVILFLCKWLSPDSDTLRRTQRTAKVNLLATTNAVFPC